MTTRQVAAEMLRTGRKPRDTHERMVLNNYLTMQRIRDLRTRDLTPELVLELHRRVTDGTMDNPDASGRLHRADENVRGDDNDLTYFLLHQAGVVKKAVASLQDYLAQKRSELSHASDALRGVADLNHRQHALLLHALREPHTRYVITGHQRSHNVSHQTAANDFHDLVARGLLVMLPGGRPRIFIAPADLGEKLNKLATAPLPSAPPPEADPTLPLNFTLRTRHD